MDPAIQDNATEGADGVVEKSILPESAKPQEAAALTASTPAMKQYLQFKAQYPNYVLFFRMGDFYEMFWEDARLCHKVLGVTLTSRSRGGPEAAEAIPMAGGPFHSVAGYLPKMIAAGDKRGKF